MGIDEGGRLLARTRQWRTIGAPGWGGEKRFLVSGQVQAHSADRFRWHGRWLVAEVRRMSGWGLIGLHGDISKSVTNHVVVSSESRSHFLH